MKYRSLRGNDSDFPIQIPHKIIEKLMRNMDGDKFKVITALCYMTLVDDEHVAATLQDISEVTGIQEVHALGILEELQEENWAETVENNAQILFRIKMNERADHLSFVVAGSFDKDSKGYLYLIMDKVHRYYKIGKTKDYSSRVKSIKTANPSISILFAKEIDHINYTEKYLHNYFADKNVNGEWFYLSKKDIEFIKNHIGLKE
jgi:hypothetical protein